MNKNIIASLWYSAMAMLDKPYKIRKGSTPNKYTPHQGKRECARRRRQRKNLTHISGAIGIVVKRNGRYIFIPGYW